MTNIHLSQLKSLSVTNPFATSVYNLHGQTHTHTHARALPQNRWSDNTRIYVDLFINPVEISTVSGV